MIHQIAISNFLFIEKAVIHFTEGLNVISGETGAGKSIFLGALNITLGEKVSADLIQIGKSSLKVVTTFDLKKLPHIKKMVLETTDLGIEDDLLFVKREINTEGRSKCFVNDQLTNIQTLKKIASTLIDVHSQHQNQRLFNARSHLEFYDQFLNLNDDLLKYREKYHRYTNVKKEIETAEATKQKLREKKEYLEFIVGEFKENLLSEEQYNMFKKQLDSLEQQEKTTLFFEKNKQVLNKSLPEISAQKDALLDLKTTNDFYKLMEEKYLIAMDALEEVKQINMDFEAQLEEMKTISIDEVNKKLAKAESLKRKYGKSLAELDEQLKHSQEQLALLVDSDSHLNKLFRQKSEIEAEVLLLADDLHKQRLTGKDVFEQKIKNEIGLLNMSGATIEMNFLNPKKEDCLQLLHSNGYDEGELIYRPSPDSSFKKLVEVASGGEISRITLCIKSLLNEKEQVPTMIFDEIDTGIGGATALRVGKKLSDLGQFRQIMVITHLAQIAKYANQHFKIEKNIENNKTITTIETLNESEKMKELARMLTGKPLEENNSEMLKKFLSE